MATESPNRSDEEALRILEAVHGVDLDDVDDDPVDPQVIARLRASVDEAFERAWSGVRARARAERDAAARRRVGLADWTRDALLTRLRALLEQLGPQVQLAHRKLESLSSDDLRVLVADLEAEAERDAGSRP